MKEPKNESVLAVILAAKQADPAQNPAHTAAIAAEVCALGRTFRRLSERLCSAPDEKGKIEKRRYTTLMIIRNILDRYGFTPTADDGLILRFEYRPGCVLALL